MAARFDNEVVKVVYDNNCNKNYFKNIEPLWIPLFFVAVAVAVAAAIIIAVGVLLLL